MASAGICSGNSPRRVFACASTCHTGRLGTPTICGGWRNGPPTCCSFCGICGNRLRGTAPSRSRLIKRGCFNAGLMCRTGKLKKHAHSERRNADHRQLASPGAPLETKYSEGESNEYALLGLSRGEGGRGGCTSLW